MSTSTKRPNTISQTTGSYASGKYYRSWSNLSNLKQKQVSQIVVQEIVIAH